MPELPDIELLKRDLLGKICGETLCFVRVLEPRLIKTEGFKNKLENQKIQNVQRYGKYLFLELGSGESLVLHLGLTGKLKIQPVSEKKLPAGSLLVIETNQWFLIYYDRQVFGLAAVCGSVEDYRKEKELGPDAAGLTEKSFFEAVDQSSGAVKAALVDQHKIAGIGNVYADEILFQAQVHPKAPIKNLSRAELKKIHAQIDKIFQWAYEVKGDRAAMPEESLMRNRKTSTKCPRCGGKVQEASVGGRETYFCASCQKLPAQKNETPSFL